MDIMLDLYYLSRYHPPAVIILYTCVRRLTNNTELIVVQLLCCPLPLLCMQTKTLINVLSYIALVCSLKNRHIASPFLGLLW